MFEQAFKNIDDILRKESGCTTELDYTEQTSWLLFLKYLDGLEADKADEAEVAGKKYSYILDKPYRWESWAAPKGKDGTLDHHKALTGDDLRDFVTEKLFPYLRHSKVTQQQLQINHVDEIVSVNIRRIPRMCEVAKAVKKSDEIECIHKSIKVKVTVKQSRYKGYRNSVSVGRLSCAQNRLVKVHGRNLP